MFKRTLADQLEDEELLVTLDVLEAEMRMQKSKNSGYPRDVVQFRGISNFKRIPFEAYGLLQYKKVTMIVFIVTFLLFRSFI